MVILEIPENAFNGLSRQFITKLTQKYAKNHRKLFQYTLAASRYYLFLRDTNKIIGEVNRRAHGSARGREGYKR
jgi:predicted acetyltransferase